VVGVEFLAENAGGRREVGKKSTNEMIVGPAIALFISTALLYLYLRWALIDPQNPCSQPGRLLTLARAFALTLAMIIAHGFAVAEPSFAANIVFSLVLGFILGPAIDPPEKLTREEEPSAIARWVHSVKMGNSGRLLKKILVIVPLTWALHYFDLPTPWYFAAGFVALFFSVVKTGITALTVEDERAKIHLLLADRGQRDHARVTAVNPLLRQSIVLLSFRGTLSLAIWLALALPLISSVPHLGFRDWAVFVGIALGAALSGIF